MDTPHPFVAILLLLGLLLAVIFQPSDDDVRADSGTPLPLHHPLRALDDEVDAVAWAEEVLPEDDDAHFHFVEVEVAGDWGTAPPAPLHGRRARRRSRQRRRQLSGEAGSGEAGSGDGDCACGGDDDDAGSGEAGSGDGCACDDDDDLSCAADGDGYLLAGPAPLAEASAARVVRLAPAWPPGRGGGGAALEVVEPWVELAIHSRSRGEEAESER